MKIRLIFAWYDLWVGAYWDRISRSLYLLPVPCVGIMIRFGHARAAAEEWAKIEAFVAEVEEDYAQPDYPRELLVEEVHELRQRVSRIQSEGK